MTPREGFQVQKRGKEWLAALAFGDRIFGGAGDVQEEAVLALLEQVLTAFEDLVSRGVRYRVISEHTVVRVRDLNARFVRELRELHRRVLDDKEATSLWESTDSSAPRSVSFSEEDLDDWL